MHPTLWDHPDIEEKVEGQQMAHNSVTALISMKSDDCYDSFWNEMVIEALTKMMLTTLFFHESAKEIVVITVQLQ